MNEYYNIPCFVINQEKQTKRLKNIKELLKNLEFKNINILKPFDPIKDTKNKLEYKLNKKIENITFNQSSHFLTYLSLLEKTDVDNMFIFEDDIIPLYKMDYIKDKIKYIVNECPIDSHMIYMEFCNESCNDFYENKFTKLNFPECTAAIYFPSLKARQELVDIIKNNVNSIGKLTTDNSFQYLINNKKINAYTIKPLFTQDLVTYKSNIEGSGDLKIHKTCLNMPKGILENRIITDDLNIKEGFLISKNQNGKSIKIVFSIIIILLIIIFILYLLFIKK